MKKILLALTLGFSVLGMAQADLSVTLNSPAANSTIGPGIPLSFDVTITNSGTVDITTADTVIYYPTLNGSILTTTVQGQTVPVAWIITGTTIAANGGTSNQVKNFSGLNVGGASAGTMSFCGNAYVYNVSESDSTNNVDCATVNYDPNSIGLVENVLNADLDLVKNDSYFANGTFFVRVENASFKSATSLSVYSISGAEVYNVSLSNDGSSINEDVNLSGLNKGIYLVEVKGLANRSVKKIAIQ